MAKRAGPENLRLSHNAKRNRRISVMLMIMWGVYVCFTLPNRLVFSAFLHLIVNHSYSDALILSANTLMYTRAALDGLFLYVSVIGFRRDVHRLVLKCCGKGHVRILPATNTRFLQGKSTQQMPPTFHIQRS